MFEAWIGDDAVGVFERTIADWLRTLADHDTQVTFLHGNRDFLLGRQFCHRAGLHLLDQPHVIDLYGRPCVLLHGDQLCTLDVQYQRYRKKIRDPGWQSRMLSRPLWFRRGVAALLRKASHWRNRKEASRETDVVDDDVEALFRQSGAELMIHGHTHRPFRHIHQVDDMHRERIVLGDWYTQGSVLTVTPDAVSLDTLQRNPSPGIADDA